jgi:outer membrane protein OmpA-like peptidoglycan-associated protein
MKPALLLIFALLLAGCQSRDTPTTSLDTKLPAIFIIFFRAGSADLTEDANASIARAADAVHATRPGQVAIASGVAQGDNLKLAQPRYLAVQQALIAKGVSTNIIVRSALPDASLPTGPAADTRVEIILTR